MLVKIVTVTATMYQDKEHYAYVIFFNLHKISEEDTVIFIFIGEKWQYRETKQLLKITKPISSRTRT